MKLFSFKSGPEELGIGVKTEEGEFNLTWAFEIYQNAKRINPPLSLTFLQVMVELDYCYTEVIEKILSDSWVRSKQESLRLADDYQIDLPIARPTKIICLGRNYHAHAKELNQKVPEEPIFFAKAPSTLIAHENSIIIPYWLDSRVDHEAELALVIGKTTKNISEEEAMSCIAGYTIINDVTARDLQKSDLNQQNPWFRSKSLDTFCPIGPYLIPSDQIQDPHNLKISLTVNGKTKQKANTSSMIFKIPKIIYSISRIMTLNPGDIIATGTPEGVSPIKDGDLVEVTISGLGTLRNRVKKEIRETS